MKIRAATEGHLPHVRKTSSHHVGPFAVAARIHSAKSGVVGVASDRRDFSASASMWKAGCFPVGLRTNGPSFQSRATASDNRQPESQRPSNNGKPTEGRRLAAVDCFAEVAKRWLEPAIAAAGPLYFAVPHASVLVKAPTDFSNTVLQVHKSIMAAA